MEAMNKEQAEFEPTPKLLEKVQERLNNVLTTSEEESEESTPEKKQEDSQAGSEEKSEESSEEESEESTPEKKQEDSQAGSEEKSEESSEEESEESTPEKKQEDSQAGSEEKSEKVKDTPSLPENFYRAAIHQDWTPEGISEFFAADPEKALKTFEKIYIATNKISQTFAKFGRNILQPQVDADQPTVKTKDAKTFVDIEALREKYEDNPLVEVVDVLQKGLQEALASKAPDAVPAAPESTGPTTEDIALAQLIGGFFASDEMKSFGEFYGGKENLTPTQDMNRYAVVQMADQIVAGAELHGQDLSADEALTMAHLCVSEPIREKTIRKNILASVKKREKGITLRPTDSKTASTKPLTEKEKEKDLEKKTTSRLAKLFKK